MKSPDKFLTRESPIIRHQFIASVIFGTPSKECQNFGICRINPVGIDEEPKKCCSRKATAIVTVFEQDWVDLDFLKSTITFCSYRKRFSKGEFIVEEDFNYSASEPFHCSFSIAKGQYRVYENRSILKVAFR